MVDQVDYANRLPPVFHSSSTIQLFNLPYTHFISSPMRIGLLPKILVAIALGASLGQIMPDILIRAFNTFNGVFDQLLKFLIPLIIVGLVTPAIADVGRSAGRMLLFTAIIAYGATLFSGFFSYGCSVWLFPSLIDGGASDLLSDSGHTFAPFFTLEIPPVMNIMTALIFSFMAGLGIAATQAPTLRTGFDEFKKIINRVISKNIIPILPVFIFGLFLDMSASSKVVPILTTFIKVIGVIFLLTFILLFIQYGIAGIIIRRNPFRLLGTMMPAYFTALGTSSSAATIPVTLKQTLQNGVSSEIAGFVIPLCATIHLSGSTLKIVACAIALMIMQGLPFDFPLFLGFIIMLGVTMVAAPGVPGGAIMAALGILDSILGFDATQQAMMITLYIAMDSFGTACNVTGDGAIALIMEKIHTRR